jgi:PTH1 family peptidyl-tRNA hydrolase
MKYLIAGLGNIGTEYEDTRHNIGFSVVEKLAENEGGRFIIDRLGSVCNIKYKGRTLVLLKPSTYMNLSGKAIQYWLNFERIPKENLLVVTDDLALPFGTLRLKAKGSDGGHNGLKSIQECLLSFDFPRLRFGVGNNFAKGRQVEYVLGKWGPDEKKTLDEKILKSTELIKAFATIGINHTMNQFNGE